MNAFATYSLILMVCFASCVTKTEKNNFGEARQAIINPQPGFRPNVLWLVAEDQSPNIPAYGDSTIATPALDRLAASGVCYDNFYTPHPVCSPARASIITGMYANRIGASHMRTGPWFSDNVAQNTIDAMAKYFPEGVKPYEAVPPPEVKMFTEYLRTAGYYCTNNSKEDYQFRKTMTAWDESGDNAHWRNRPEGKPFFAVFNFEVTHESQIWRKAKDSLWVAEDLPVPVPPYLPNTETGRRDIRRMYSNILEMDSQVGKILDELEEDGLLDSTIVMWYTDHGGPLPRQKRFLYDAGIKVPMIIRFPGGQYAGLRDNRMISFVDLAPTMLSLAGVQPKDYMDGSAFLGKYVREVEPQYVFGAADRFDEKYDRVRSVRDKRYKYIRYYMPEKPMFLEVTYRNQMPIMQELLRLRERGKLTEVQALWFRPHKPKEELFDLKNDPHEIHNLADDPAYKDKLKELRHACKMWVTSINDTGLKDEIEIVESMWPGQVQPATADPEVNGDGQKYVITCKTAGATIGYKLIGRGDDAEKMPWTIYQEPVQLPAGRKLVVVADRIGYKRSNEVQVKN